MKWETEMLGPVQTWLKKELYLRTWMFPPSQNGRSGGRMRFHSAIFGFHSITLLEILSLPLLWVSSIKSGSSYFVGKHHEKVNCEWYHFLPYNTNTTALWKRPERNSFFSSRLCTMCDIQKSCISLHPTSSVLYRDINPPQTWSLLHWQAARQISNICVLLNFWIAGLVPNTCLRGLTLMINTPVTSSD